MSDSIQVQMVNDRAATISVTRKVSPKQYESLEVGLFLPVELPERLDSASDAEHTVAVQDALRTGINLGKVMVYDALGIEYTDNNGLIAEKVAARVEGKVEAAPRPARSSAAPAQAASSQPPASGEKACPKCGGAMWDNRVGKTNPKQPDFKCKDKANCDGVIWPPRNR